ncbi:hypothetical protein PoB_001472500 [Plakobranchus ocellatus]|uniref:Uncharacterized protein n=1 Tax=Plakobranchus ocellatus TaxID=259542 RepID=A0AAV3YYG0_9GAST|nr:hypothetical protein PoB_001472500 [Plakobranchus ocellatus]
METAGPDKQHERNLRMVKESTLMNQLMQGIFQEGKAFTLNSLVQVPARNGKRHCTGSESKLKITCATGQFFSDLALREALPALEFRLKVDWGLVRRD